MAGWWKRKQKT